MNRIRAIEAQQIRDDLPAFQVGDTVKISYKVVEGWEQLPAGYTHRDVDGVAVDSRDRVYIITRYDPTRAARGEMLTIEDVLEILAMPLLGIIPESQEVLRASNVGCPVTLNNVTSAPSRAYVDAARRLMGETVAMKVPVERKGLMNRLLGRRAA